ncbi:MAG: hypothetical protein HUN04_11050 [Desulfobacter sp.]|nr:MAG: hypothetical protein HUN04_11050 [Desulfobacter sp.]
MRPKFHPTPWIFFIVLLLAGLITDGFCQEINLDKMKKAGDLICYPSLKDAKVWYYLPDRPRLATKNGRPQFSFLKYSRLEKQGKAGTHAAQGGGILHFLVTYGADKSRVRNAERRLQEEFPEARLEGPIVYRKGSFALVTSFTTEQETLVKTVAVGKAPLMEGQKAAVSMALSREGAELLWESFKGDTPDISLVFDMEFAGIREPYEATLEADWSRIASHKQLKAGFKYSWFGADVDMLFQELRQTGAIKITTKGENAAMDKILDSANAKLLQVMFDPAPVDDLSRAAAEKDSYSNLNQAMKLLKANQTAAKTSLNLNSPGFRQMIAAVIDAVIPEAHAAVNYEDMPGMTKTYAEKLTQDQLMQLKMLIRPAMGIDQDMNALEAALPLYKLYLDQYKAMTGINLPAPDLRYKIGRIHYSIGQSQEALDWFQCCCHTRDCIQFQHTIEKEMSGNGTSNTQAPAGKTAQKTRQKKTKSNSTQRQTADTDTAPTLPPLPGENQAPADTQNKNDIRNTPKAPDSPSGEDTAAEAYNRARRLDNDAVKSGYDPDKTMAALDAYEYYLGIYSPTGSRKKEVEGRIRSLQRRLVPDPDTPDKNQAPGNGIENQISNETPLAPLPGTDVTATTPPASNAKETAPPAAAPQAAGTKASDTAAKKKAAKSSAVKKAAEKAPGFSLVASFKLKKIKRSGRMVYKMNHFRSEMQSFTMAENIGNLYSRYGRDSRIFRAVAIDDPVFKQREILVTLDGQDTATFTRYMNFVTVKMKKIHQNGDISTDEVVITPEAFNLKANAFSLNYGYKGDSNRNQWLAYQYQVTWSFHGGLEIRSPWQTDTKPMLALAPPYQYKGLTIEGEGDTLDRAGVRHALVTVNSFINGRPVKTQATIKNQGPAPALHLDFPRGRDEHPVEVGIKWFLRGGKILESSLQPLEGDIFYWDELP